MACEQLISHLSASGRYLQNLAAEHHGTALTGQIVAVKCYIAKIAGPAEALRASEAIQTHFGPYLTKSQLIELQGLLNDAACKLPLVVPAGKGRGKRAAEYETQYWHDSFWRDVPHDVMIDIGDKNVLATARMQKIFNHLANRGLRIPSEKTFVAMLTLFFYVDGCPAGITSATLLAAVQQIKDSWKIYIESYKESLPNAQASLSWPGNPPGVVCVRLDFIRFTNIFTQIPCRHSHGSLHKPPANALSPFLPKSGNGSGSMRRALSLEDTAEANAGGPLAIDYQGHRSIDAGALVGRGEDLVVRAPAAEQALPGPAAQLALPAPAVEVQTAPARVSLAAVTAQLRADAEKRETEKKAKAKNKKAKNKKAAGKKKTAGKNAGKTKEADDSGAGDEDNPPAKGRKAKRRKLETEKAKEAAEAAKEAKKEQATVKAHNSKMHILASKTVTALSTGCESLKKEGAGKKTTAGKNAGQKKEAAGKKKSAGKKRAAMEDARKMGKIAKKRRILKKRNTLAKASKAQGACSCSEGDLQDAQPAISGQEEISGQKKEAAGEKPAARKWKAGIFKKPAARSKPETPAARSKPKVARPPADVCFVMRNGTPQERAALYKEYGCGKCRYKPGCSNSCWTARNMQKPREGSLLFVSRSGFRGKWGRTVNFS